MGVETVIRRIEEMQFTRIRLENWRNFGKVDVPVDRRVFLVGANASGKSNLLDALRFLRDLVKTGGGFQSAIESRGGVSKIRNLAARKITQITLDVDLGEGRHRLWRYRLVFNQDNNRRPVLKEEKAWDSCDKLVLCRPDEDDKRDDVRLRQTQLEQVFANEKFRDIADFFRSISYSHIVPQLVRDPDRNTGQTNDPFGSDFLEQIAIADKRNQGANLRRIQDVVRKVIQQLSDLELWRDERGSPHLRIKYEHWRPKGAWQNETDLSDGTLRLIGFLWALQEGRGPLLLEEPELSLHPALVRYLPQLMNEIQRVRRKALRQVILSTHSPELLMDEGIGAHEVLLIRPAMEGSEVILGADNSDIMNELQHGLAMSEIVMSRTQPSALEQLLLLG